jgi:hypothetical protein
LIALSRRLGVYWLWLDDLVRSENEVEILRPIFQYPGKAWVKIVLRAKLRSEFFMELVEMIPRRAREHVMLRVEVEV